ncbi:hypothetical protein XENORESO_012587 [Xenotaenia resolanae]|uniref:Uncharacterized protein n=1 Tax=Xenotaenia resolanae TaxID=208358 RepID=A0ABV0WQU6_9TELE
MLGKKYQANFLKNISKRNLRELIIPKTLLTNELPPSNKTPPSALVKPSRKPKQGSTEASWSQTSYSDIIKFNTPISCCVYQLILFSQVEKASGYYSIFIKNMCTQGCVFNLTDGNKWDPEGMI